MVLVGQLNEGEKFFPVERPYDVVIEKKAYEYDVDVVELDPASVVKAYGEALNDGPVSSLTGRVLEAHRFSSDKAWNENLMVVIRIAFEILTLGIPLLLTLAVTFLVDVCSDVEYIKTSVCLQENTTIVNSTLSSLMQGCETFILQNKNQASEEEISYWLEQSLKNLLQPTEESLAIYPMVQRDLEKLTTAHGQIAKALVEKTTKRDDKDLLNEYFVQNFTDKLPLNVKELYRNIMRAAIAKSENEYLQDIDFEIVS